MTSPAIAHDTTRPLLVDRLWSRPDDHTRRMVRTATLVAGFALFTAAMAQVEITLGFTPVPITGQTMAVLVAGASLGMRLGAASQALYWVLGLVGLPLYAGGEGGWQNGTGATLGYLVGFVVAAAVVGRLAERQSVRSLGASTSAMALGSVVIYVFGAGWLAHHLGLPVATGETNAISLGVTPFLIGDLVKLALAGALMPAAWGVVDRLAED
jgi:biotin transport system substrate-specific component